MEVEERAAPLLVPAVDLCDVRRRVPLSVVLRFYGLTRKLTKTPAGFEGECPFCHSPGFAAECSTERFRCGRCERTGGSVEFVMHQEGVSPWIAGIMLADWFRVAVRVTRVEGLTTPAEHLSLPMSAFANSAGYALGQLVVSLGCPAEVEPAVREIYLAARAVMLAEST